MPDELISPPDLPPTGSEGGSAPRDREGVRGEISRAIIRGLLPLVMLGVLIVLLALLLLRWPAGVPGDSVETIPHLLRLTQPLDDSVLNLPLRLLDASIYLVVMIGMALIVVAWRHGARNAVIGLITVAILGLAYTSGMALYIGPMVSICGFSLILFGGLIALAALPSPDTELETELDADNNRVEVRTNDHASHFVA